MEKIVEELKKIICFKDTTVEGDVVLIAMENPQTVFYALVTSIVPDESKRGEWWHIGLTILSVPPQEVVWTLREAQFTGMELFTMADEGRFMKAVDLSTKAVLINPEEDRTVTEKNQKKKPSLRRVK